MVTSKYYTINEYSALSSVWEQALKTFIPQVSLQWELDVL